MLQILKSVFLSLFLLVAITQSAFAWCVLNDSVLPLAVFGEPKSQTKLGQIEKLKAEIKCLEAKKNETMQDDFYRYNFYGLDDD
jgi:hypothetical protein